VFNWLKRKRKPTPIEGVSEIKLISTSDLIDELVARNKRLILVTDDLIIIRGSKERVWHGVTIPVEAL